MKDEQGGRVAHGPGGTVRAYLELVRLPNVFTAAADVVMGFLFVRGVDGVRDGGVLGLLVAASSLLYAAGVVLNDLADLPVDARQRPERPLPSGRVSPAAAFRLGWTLLVVGTGSAWAAGFLSDRLWPGVTATLLAACIVAYDGWLKRTATAPAAMGACRMLNVLLGMSVAGWPRRSAAWLVAAAIGTYVAGITWFARHETRRSRRGELLLATGVTMLGIGLLAWLPTWTAHLVPLLRRQPERWYLLAAVLGLVIGWRCLWAFLDPVPQRVQAAVQLGILSIIVLDAAVCAAVRGTVAGVAVLLLLAPSVVLGRWIRLT